MHSPRAARDSTSGGLEQIIARVITRYACTLSTMPAIGLIDVVTSVSADVTASDPNSKTGMTIRARTLDAAAPTNGEKPSPITLPMAQPTSSGTISIAPNQIATKHTPLSAPNTGEQIAPVRYSVRGVRICIIGR